MSISAYSGLSWTPGLSWLHGLSSNPGLSFASSVTPVAPVFIIGTGASGGPNTVSTVTPIDTTGATLIIVAASYDELTTNMVMSDSQGNVYIPLEQFPDIAERSYIQFWYSINPETSPAMTWTFAASQGFPTIGIQVFSTPTTYMVDQQNGNDENTTATIQPGSITPLGNNAIVVSGLTYGTADPLSINDGFNLTYQSPNGSSYGIGDAYFIQGAAAAINPTWSITNPTNLGANIADFIPVSSGPYLLSVGGAASTTSNGVTSPAMKTTGAKLIVVIISQDSASPGTFSDSENNTWIPLNIYPDSADSNLVQSLYCINLTTSDSHTFSVTGSGNFANINILAFGYSGTLSFDQQNGNSTSSSTTLQPGSVTPVSNNDIIITAMVEDLTANVKITVDSGMNIVYSAPVVTGESFALNTAYIIQSTAAMINPTWTIPSATNMAANISSFKIATGPYLLTATGATSTDTNTAETAAANTDSAKLIIIAVSWYTATTTPVLTDSASNTWTPLTEYNQTNSDAGIQFYYCVNPTTSATHTFTVTGAGSFPAIAMAAFAGISSTPSFDQQNGAITSGSQTTIQPGSITPTANNEIIVSAISFGTESSFTFTVDSGFLPFYTGPCNATATGIVMGFYIQPTAAAINPTWTSSALNSMASNIASFKT